MTQDYCSYNGCCGYTNFLAGQSPLYCFILYIELDMASVRGPTASCWLNTPKTPAEPGGDSTTHLCLLDYGIKPPVRPLSSYLTSVPDLLYESGRR